MEDDFEYLNIIKGMKELPFEVGKNLLADFILGNYKNKSISKNQLDTLHFFGCLNWEKEKVINYINKMLKNRLIEEFSPDYNKFVKVLRLTIRGEQELFNPKLNNKKIYFKNVKKVEEEDIQKFTLYEDFLDGFNNEQKQAIISDSNRILTVAGAGTGKTTTLIKRIEFLIKYKQVAPSNILAITFTRKARQEMINKLERLNIKDVNVHTFNSFCEDVLRKNEQLIYGKKMKVISYSDKILSIHMALSLLGLDFDLVIREYFTSRQQGEKSIGQLQNIFMNDCFSIIEYFKTTNQKFYDFSANVDEKDKKNAKLLYNIVSIINENMKTNNLRDYTDQLMDTISFFKRYPNYIPYFEHILVDEYQDVNVQQVTLIKLLNSKNLFVVGDPRQSIYGWRGGDINYILNFEQDFSGSEIINLTKNYRSNKKIVQLMNEIIKDMELKNLESTIEDMQVQAKIFSFENEDAEISFVLEYLKETKEKLNDIFILSRTNRQLNTIGNILNKMNINYILKTEENFDVKTKEGFLTLATVHAIKGLEAKTVFVIGSNTQNFPCKASDNPIIEYIKNENYDKESEELRLFYVAVSRAKRKLYITYSGTISPFITESIRKLLW